LARQIMPPGIGRRSIATQYQLSAALRAHCGLRRIFVTDERATPVSKPVGKRRVSHKRPESKVDRPGLATVVSKRLAELAEHGTNQTEAANRAGCAVSTLRNMQNGTGTSHYRHDLLREAARGLGLPEDRLVDAFYPPLPPDPALPSQTDVMVQRVVNELEPCLAQMQTSIISEVEKGMSGMQKWLEDMAQDVANKVSSQLKTLVDINHLPADESPGPASRLRSLSPAAR
jgi:transcriptional regulator with XRE-family HTH domain